MCSTDEDESCWLNKCEGCVDKKSELQSDILKILQENQIDYVDFVQWKFSERDQKKTFHMTAEKFAEYAAKQLKNLKFHDYVYKKQDEEFSNLKKNLAPNQIIINMDYAENYKVAHQNEPQQGHFNKRQISMLTCYMHMNRGTGKIEERSVVVLSDESCHGTASVYTCYEKIHDWLKLEFPDQEWAHIYIVTDGCGGILVSNDCWYFFVGICRYLKAFEGICRHL